MLMARLWPFVSAFVAIDFGRPTLERNHLGKCVTHSTHSSAEISSRSNTGANSAGVTPRFPVRICLAVQSSSCRYSPIALVLALAGLARKPVLSDITVTTSFGFLATSFGASVEAPPKTGWSTTAPQWTPETHKPSVFYVYIVFICIWFVRHQFSFGSQWPVRMFSH